MSRNYNSSKKYGGDSESLENEIKVIPMSQRVKTVARAQRKELADAKMTWKARLPTLTPKDVRRYRVPLGQVVILELEEDGYMDAAQFMKMLFVLNEEMRTKAGPGTVIWTSPRLKDCANFVERLKTGLADANRAMLQDDRVAQIAALLEVALFFQETSWEWWWIAEQLFRSALNVSETVDDDDSQTITTVQYLYGRFLFNEIKDDEESIKILEKARETSEGRSWNATKVLGTRQDSIFRECCTLLYRALLRMVRKSTETDADLMVEACQNALKHAVDSGHDECITDATCELGRIYMRADQPKLALQNFVRYLNLSREILDYDGICNAHMELAFAYKDLGDTAKTMEHLELFRETASRFELPYKLAQAHYHIGEHLLSRNSLAQATSHLEFAFSLYNGLGKSVEANQARCIAAVSKGQEVVDQFIEQILRCGRYEKAATLKLCDWKNNRVPFWKSLYDEDREESYGEGNCEDTSKSESLQSPSDYKTSSESELIEVHSLGSNASPVSVDLTSNASSADFDCEMKNKKV